MARVQTELGDFVIDVEASGIRDSLQKAIVTNEPPGEDGGALSDQGLKTRVFSFRAWFIGTEFEEAEAFAESLEEREDIEFIHPDLGGFFGKIVSAESVRDDKPDSVAFDIVFWENLLGAILPFSILNISDSVNASWFDNIQNQISAAGRAIDNALSGLSTVSGLGRQFTAVLDSSIDVLDGTLSTLTNPANSLIGITDFGTDLPGRLIGSVARMAERNLQALDSLKNLPSAFSKNFKANMTAAQVSLNKALGNLTGQGSSLEIKKDQAKNIVAAQLTINSASVLGVKMGEIFNDDNVTTSQIRDQQNQATFDDNGKILSSSPPRDIMTLNQMEAGLTETKEFLQEAVVLDRNLVMPRDIAVLLQRHVSEVKLQLPVLKTIIVNVPTPLPIILHGQGLSYQLMDEIVALNPSVRTWGAVKGAIKVFASA